MRAGTNSANRTVDALWQMLLASLLGVLGACGNSSCAGSAPLSANQTPVDEATNTTRELLRRASVPHADQLAAMQEPAVRIVTTRTSLDDLPLGTSRFGGSPDLPSQFAWPRRDGRPLTFLAQIELSVARAPQLPDTGWLVFFYDVRQQPWGFDPKDRGAWLVAWIPSENALERRPHPAVDDGSGPFAASRLTFTPVQTLPDAWDSVVTDRGIGLEESALDAYDGVLQAIVGVGDDELFHHLLGHPQQIQDDMRGECQLASHGIYCGDASGYKSAAAKPLLETAAREWRLLLQIDTDESGPGWMWGDAGRIYFWIRHEDLKARAFDKVWLVLQCG